MKQNDAIVVTDFTKLNPVDFLPVYGCMNEEFDEQLLLLSKDGRIFVNSNYDRHSIESFVTIFSMAQKEKTKILKRSIKQQSKIFPNIKNLNDFAYMEDTKQNKTKALVMVCLHIELKRREIAKDYEKGVSNT